MGGGRPVNRRRVRQHLGKCVSVTDGGGNKIGYAEMRAKMLLAEKKGGRP